MKTSTPTPLDRANPIDDALFAALTDLCELSLAGAGLTAEVAALVDDVVHPRTIALEALLNERLAAEIEPRAAEPHPPQFTRADDLKGRAEKATRLDHSVRLMRGRWSAPGDVKVVVDLAPGGVEVFLSTWMASDEESDRFTRWIRRSSSTLRPEIVALSDRLQQRYGVAIDLKYTNRADSESVRSRKWPERPREWTIWTGNEQRQASLGVYLAQQPSANSIVDRAYASEVPDRWEAAAKALQGLGGRLLLENQPEGPTDRAVLLNAVERIGDAAERHRLRLLAEARMTDLVLDAALGLVEIQQRFRDQRLERPRTLVSVRPSGAPAVAWNATPPEIAVAVATLVRHAVGPAGSDALTPSGTGSSATVRWLAPGQLDRVAAMEKPPAASAYARVTVRRARKNGPVELAFHLGRLGASMGEDRMLPLWRENLRLALDAPAGDDLLGLVRSTGNAIRFSCGRKNCAPGGRCPVHSHDALLGHWLSSREDPSLVWTIPSDAGQADWLEAPAQLMAGLLAQGAWEPGRLLVPTGSHLEWDAFVSTRGHLHEASDQLANGLVQRGVSAWHMADHQAAGADVRENMLAGVARSRVLLLLLSDDYAESAHCVQELATAIRHGKPIVPALVTSGRDLGGLASAESAVVAARIELARRHATELKFDGAVVDAVAAHLDSFWNGDQILAVLPRDGITPAAALDVIEAGINAAVAR